MDIKDMIDITGNNDVKNDVKLYNIEAEQSLLGLLIKHNDLFHKVHDKINTDSFYEPVHGRIYNSIKKIITNNNAATPVTLKNIYDNDPALDNLGGSIYLVRLGNDCPLPHQTLHFCTILSNLANRRNTLKAVTLLSENIYNFDIEIDNTIIELQKTLSSIEDNNNTGKNIESISDVVSAVVDNIGMVIDGKQQIELIKTGLNELDNILGGFGNSELIILAARPAMGKTALALQFLVSCAEMLKQNDKSSLFFSLEMGKNQIAQRLLASKTGISSNRMRNGQVGFDEYMELSQKQNSIPDNIFIDETGGIDIDLLCARARTLKRNNNLGLIIIDYLQLVTTRYNFNNRVQQVSEISAKLKSLAKELNVPIVALSQLSRALENREDKRPMLQDLRESGSIEQDADTVMFLYREVYYIERNEPSPMNQEKHKKWDDLMSYVQNKAQISVAKFRHGTTGVAHVNFNANTGVFYD